MIDVRSLTVQYGDKKVFSDITFNVAEGELVLVKGDNGSGKSTLCYALSGIIPRNIDAQIMGSVYLDGKDIDSLTQAELTKTVGIVIQNPDNMLFSPSVEDELAFAPENLCLKRDEIEERVESAIKLTNIHSLRYISPDKLSGGEKQRVAIASVLTLDPKIIIFEEVLSCLDKENLQY